MPKVSIIVPVFGVESFIERCARSLFEQTLKDIEYLFIDDCTPDHSIDVLHRVMDDYPERKREVVIHHMKKNSGQAAVRVWGIRNATGEYLIHCDSDDWVDPEYCRTMYEKAIRENADTVVCDYVISDGQSIIKSVKGCGSTDKEAFINNMLLQRDPWSLCNKLFRRKACCKEDIVFPKGNMGEDMLITFQMVLASVKIAYVNEPLYHYFFNPASITKTTCNERLFSNFLQFKENADLLLYVFSRESLDGRYFRGLTCCKWAVKRFLWNLNFDKGIRSVWRETYPELGRYLLRKKTCFTSKETIKYILTDLGLYPIKHYGINKFNI